jgi:pimeloyl-ACP methyl ester carboxylesterase
MTHHPERLVTVGELQLCHDAFGEPEHPPMLLVMGLGFQLVHWPEDLCRQLAAEGFRVIRFDNRDAGRSTHLPGQRYSVDDMADDAVGLLDRLGIDRAHVVGASMGGMLAQLMAAWWPERVRSLVSIMSNTGSLRSGQPALRLYPSFLARPPRSKEEYVDRLVKVFGIIGSSGFERDEGDLRLLAETAFDRGADPAGSGRQLAAIQSSGSRVRDLRRIKAPTLVIHGTADLLVRPSGGRATARAIPNARLQLIDGMGHDLPRGAWPQIIDGIVGNAAAASPLVAA